MEALLTTLGALTLFGSVLWFWILTIAFIVICFISDVSENGFFAFGTLIVLVILYYLKANIDPLLAFFSLAHILIYLLIGLFYSIMRTFLYGRRLGKELKGLPLNNDDGKNTFNNQEYKTKEYVDKLKGNVFRWWFMWPISFINWLVSDLIKDCWDYLYSLVNKWYNYILRAGINTVK
jgi:hypothetical protein